MKSIFSILVCVGLVWGDLGWGRGCPHLTRGVAPIPYHQRDKIISTLWRNSVRLEMGPMSVERMESFRLGGLSLLKNVGGRFDNGYPRTVKTMFFMDNVILKLPEEVQQGGILSILHLRDWDGREAFRDRFSMISIQRVFEAFAGMCHAWNLQVTAPNQRIDLMSLHTLDGTRKALRTMGIYTLHDDEVMTFHQGGLPLLQVVGGAENGFSLQTRSRFFQEILPAQFDGLFEYQLSRLVSQLRLFESDGREASRVDRMNVSALFRMYLAWAEVLMLWNQRHPDEPIDIARVHTEEGMQDALHTMGIYVLSPRYVDVFATQVLPLMLEVRRYYAAGFTSRTRSNFFDTIITSYFPEKIQEEARAAISFLNDADGRDANRSRYTVLAVHRIYQAWVAILKLWNQSYEERDEDRVIDLRDLHTRAGMLDALYTLGMELP